MLSYLHGYHAGSAADVLKHSVLIFCLEYLRKKEKPVLCVDTHAGAGFYDPAVMPNHEWEGGMGRLVSRAGPPESSQAKEAMPSMVAGYLKIAGTEKQRYSGSAVIMAKMLRANGAETGDRLVCFELHPREFEALNASMACFRTGRSAIEVRREDGISGLKSLLPPPSRRGLILIDPSWEEQSDYEDIPRAAGEGLKRFPGGTFIIWYPLLALPKKKAAVPLRDRLFGFPGVKRCRAELCTGAPESSPRCMYGSGLVVYNPPWTLKPALEQALPYLAKILGKNDGGWYLDSED